MVDRKVDALYLEAPTEQFKAIILYTVEPCKTLRVRYPLFCRPDQCSLYK
jgi:hypothetical protein